jgi:hypothetical protein
MPNFCCSIWVKRLTTAAPSWPGVLYCSVWQAILFTVSGWGARVHPRRAPGLRQWRSGYGQNRRCRQRLSTAGLPSTAEMRRTASTSGQCHKRTKCPRVRRPRLGRELIGAQPQPNARDRREAPGGSRPDWRRGRVWRRRSSSSDRARLHRNRFAEVRPREIFPAAPSIPGDTRHPVWLRRAGAAAPDKRPLMPFTRGNGALGDLAPVGYGMRRVR